MRSRPRLVVAVVLTALVGALLTAIPSPGIGGQAAAADAADFEAGFLVSDQLLYDGEAMSAGQVQSFIQSKHDGCAADYTCLDTYTQDTIAIPADAYCDALTASEDESAASIIARVGLACDISQRALLVTMEKEQSLVTMQAPTAVRYERAMGFACPDRAPCDTAFGGFYYQVYFAARQFNRYAAHPENYNHQPGVVEEVLYHPNVACGTSPVPIRNFATAGLYNYTPYQPNQAALDNLYGTGDSCSAYGNRNFWRIWTDWFGDSQASEPIGSLPVHERVAGDSRYETAVAISQRSFSAGAEVVYVASGQNFPDGLAAGPAAAHQGGPVLLTPTAQAPTAMLDEIERLAPTTVVIVGGTPSVSADVQAAIEELGEPESESAPSFEVLRLDGDDRYETSRLIARHAFDAAADVFVATGLKFPDALAAGPAAAFRDGPVLLVDGVRDALDDPTRATLQQLGAERAGIAGDASSVSEGIASGLGDAVADVQRFAGADRYETAAQLRGVFGDVGTAYLASGTSFADALAGAAVAGAESAPMLLARRDCMPEVTRGTLSDALVDEVVVLGGLPTLRVATATYSSCG